MKGFRKLIAVCALAGLGAQCLGETRAILMSADGKSEGVALSALQRLEIVEQTDASTMKAVLGNGETRGGLRLVAFKDVSGVNSVCAPNDGIAVYPNPVAERLYVSGAGEETDVRVMDSNGKVVLRSRGAEVSVSALPSGLYLVEVDGLYARFIKK